MEGEPVEIAVTVGERSSWVRRQKTAVRDRKRKPNFPRCQDDEMNWSRTKYFVRLEDGGEEPMTGIANRLFGLSADGVLTHLKTGYRVARFPDQATGKAAGDYLAAAYAAEFDALHKAFRRSMTYDQFRSLAEAIDLDHKINDDRDFNRQLHAAGVELTGGGQ